MVVQRQTVQMRVALRVDKDLNAVKLKDLVAGPGLVLELELIRQPRAAPAHHTQPQAAHDTILLKRLADFLHRFRSYVNHKCHSTKKGDSTVGSAPVEPRLPKHVSGLLNR